MTVSTTATRSGPFYPNGVTTSFPFSFQAASGEEVRVYRLSSSYVQTEITAGYAVSLNGDNTGMVTFDVAPLAGDPLYVESDPNFIQSLQFKNQGPYLAENHEAGFDRDVIRDLWMRERISRSIIAGGGLANSLYGPGFVAIGADGTPFVAVGTIAGVPVSAFMSSVLSVLNARALRQAQGLDFVIPQDFGAIGNNVADDTLAFQAMFDTGKDVLLTLPVAGYIVSEIVVTKPVRMTSAGRNVNGDPIILHKGNGGTAPCFRIKSSHVHLSGFQVWCETGKKAVAETEPTFLMDTANIAGATIEDVMIENFLLKWTGGVLHDNGGSGAWQRTTIRQFTTLVQRGRAFKFTRGFASIFLHDGYVDKNRSGGLYGGENMAEFNYPMLDAVVPVALSGAGGVFGQGLRLAGSNYVGATNDHGILLGQDGAGGGGFRFVDCDIDATSGDAFNALFLDEIVISLCRFSALNGHGIIVDRIGKLSGKGNRLDGKNVAGKYAVWVKGTNNRYFDFDAITTRFSSGLLRMEGTGHDHLHGIRLYDEGRLSGEQVADPWFKAAFTSGANPNDGVVTANIRAGVGGGAGTVAREGFGSVSQIDGQVYARNVMRFNQTGAGTAPYLDVVVQPADIVANNWVTMDFYVRDGAGGSYNITPQIVQKFGTGGSPSADVVTSFPTVGVTSSFRRIAATLLIPSVVGKTFGTGNDDSVRVRLLLPNTTFQMDLVKFEVRLGAEIKPMPVGVGGSAYS